MIDRKISRGLILTSLTVSAAVSELWMLATMAWTARIKNSVKLGGFSFCLGVSSVFLGACSEGLLKPEISELESSSIECAFIDAAEDLQLITLVAEDPSIPAQQLHVPAGYLLDPLRGDPEAAALPRRMLGLQLQLDDLSPWVPPEGEKQEAPAMGSLMTISYIYGVPAESAASWYHGSPMDVSNMADSGGKLIKIDRYDDQAGGYISVREGRIRDFIRCSPAEPDTRQYCVHYLELPNAFHMTLTYAYQHLEAWADTRARVERFLACLLDRPE